MKPVKTISGIAAPLLRINVDTDAIIPSREIKAVSKKGLSEGLFSEWRYTSMADRKPNEEFVLNQEPYNRSAILLTGDNFGCGSSREHAVWALQEWGIKALIGTTFGSIFFENCIRNGLLPIELSSNDMQKLIHYVEKDPASNQIMIDLEKLSINFGSSVIVFDFDKKYQTLLLEGLDEIQQTLKLDNEISSFEEKHFERNPWL
ncbi:MAG: 3-isopropylmalate dehydratase small subunit [Euryarchaeota archaeon]|jgi:3-isopropylmalate/(R)-2-methylmalate dehydratase small subunit|nr:3-isopropylmalate dehydratase small subunit [Euryarchaeota archaeon]MCH1531013.1 3-isopropylmalate dehydratase small subunit [Gammaproteobacteria bacterium]MDB3990980.1 3-isopropylmalate dehydratase small subunit [Gammaproteobacteria bacterium]MDC0222591.1 3-isopropylmalate dehydratase small subunit [Gammaproteobacteria bacterium]MDC0225341.1 3-isopropylmalate dehydratase small subunit [Gammaproteobacteria bacterium]|tara:strand:+ start:1407 stop:2018 length:612 start_codon:yes stop_codon:yes gene_type:complete